MQKKSQPKIRTEMNIQRLGSGTQGQALSEQWIKQKAEYQGLKPKHRDVTVRK